MRNLLNFLQLAKQSWVNRILLAQIQFRKVMCHGSYKLRYIPKARNFNEKFEIASP
jgi:hypothetical protein